MHYSKPRITSRGMLEFDLIKLAGAPFKIVARIGRKVLLELPASLFGRNN